MQIDTLIIGYVPLLDLAGKKPSEIRGDNYFKELLSGFDLGTVDYANHQNWKEKIDLANPLVIVVLSGEYFAKEVRRYKNDALLYAAEDASRVFYRKAEIDKKKERNVAIFTEVSKIIQKIRDDGEKEASALRKFASMSYDDLHQMIIQAIIGEDEDLRKKAWELLNDNHGHSTFVWMRAQILGEVWQECDGKGKEEYLCMAMNQHIDNEMARKMDNFTDADGQEYHQYMFCDLFGHDLNYIRRIPIGFKGQEKWTYQAILDKYETPTGLQVMLEAGQVRTQKKEYFENETSKVLKVLTLWKENPSLSKKELGVVPWEESDSEDDPLTERELNSMKGFLKKHDEENFAILFN
jgi:hypothetical protein